MIGGSNSIDSAITETATIASTNDNNGNNNTTLIHSASEPKRSFKPLTDLPLNNNATNNNNTDISPIPPIDNFQKENYQ